MAKVKLAGTTLGIALGRGLNLELTEINVSSPTCHRRVRIDRTTRWSPGLGITANPFTCRLGECAAGDSGCEFAAGDTITLRMFSLFLVHITEAQFHLQGGAGSRISLGTCLGLGLNTVNLRVE